MLELIHRGKKKKTPNLLAKGEVNSVAGLMRKSGNVARVACSWMSKVEILIHLVG
jgi:hypothetical protein